jgi:hypothetical protein
MLTGVVDPNEKKFQSKSPFIQTGVLVGCWFTHTKNYNNGGTHTCNTFVHTSKQASEQSSHTFGRLPPVIKCFLFPKDLILP